MDIYVSYVRERFKSKNTYELLKMRINKILSNVPKIVSEKLKWI